MMPSGGKFILDACALLRLLQDEPGADRIDMMLQGASARKHRVQMHIINLGEVIYSIGKAFGWEVAQRKREEIQLLPISIIPFSDHMLWKAVELKSKFALSYADCFAAAAAILEDATLLTSDPEFRVVNRLVKIEHV